MTLITGKHLPRRTFLRGMGVTVALPYLDAFVPAGKQWIPTVAGAAPDPQTEGDDAREVDDQDREIEGVDVQVGLRGDASSRQGRYRLASGFNHSAGRRRRRDAGAPSIPK